MQLTLDHWVSADKRSFLSKKELIIKALGGSTGMLDGVTEDNKEDIFYELLFCLSVPQNRASKAEQLVENLRNRNFYSKDLTLKEVEAATKGFVRFDYTKHRLITAKEMFLVGSFWSDLQGFDMAYTLSVTEDKFKVLLKARRYLVKLVYGMAEKLASQFVRNIGMRDPKVSGLAILDTHVIKGMDLRGLIPDEHFSMPERHLTGKQKGLHVGKIDLTKSHYYAIEEVMKEYADQVGITIESLDLLLWSQKTGYVFK